MNFDMRFNHVRPAGEPILTLRNVSKRFSLHQERRRSLQELFIGLLKRTPASSDDFFWSLRDVNLSVEPGDSVGIIGPNGSGKSTLLKLIAGILEPTAGEIVVNGRISPLLELGAGFHPDLTGRENIFLNGSIHGLSHQEIQDRLDSIIGFAELGRFIDMPVKHYSSGMYVRLGFAVAIHTGPDLLLVDEVLAVGDTAFQHKCLDAIQDFRKQGGTLLLVSHDLGAIQSICGRAVWFDHGQVRAGGHPTDVVMKYLSHVADEEETSARQELAPLEDSQRWGTGRVEITRVELCDRNMEPRSAFVTGGPMEIWMHYRTQERIEYPIFGIAIHHQNGTHICGPNTGFGRVRIPVLQGEGRIGYRIPSLSLLEGGYTVSVAVVNRDDTEMYDYHDRAYPFRVYPGSSTEKYGLVTMNGEWHMERDVPRAETMRPMDGSMVPAVHLAER